MSYHGFIVMPTNSGDQLGEFGKKFRKVRESRKLSFDDVSNVTKISSRMLQAIEEEHFDQLPGGVFNKGFIRAYAKHLGLDPEDAVSDYLACLRQAQIAEQQTWQPEDRSAPRTAPSAKSTVTASKKPAAQPRSGVEVEELPELQLPRIEDVRPPRKKYLDRPSSGIPWALIAVAAVVALLAFLLWNRHSRTLHSVAAKSNNVAASAPAAPAPPPSDNSRLTPIATATASPRPSSPGPHPSQPAPSAAATPQSVSSTSPAVEEEKNDVATGSNSPEPAAKPPAKAAAALTLVIRATETSWISVTSDGETVRQETLIAPAATTIHASREIVAHIGNAAGVTFLWNGEEIPAQGTEAEVITLVFDSQGMHPLSSTPAPAQNQ